jgi:predicted enzyme related to lactoylglutathione lyase
MISSIGQIAITVSSIESALGFYRDVLGLPLLFSTGPNIAFLQSGETRIMLSTPQGTGEVGKNSILYFKTNHIESFFEQCIQKGAIEERKPQLAAKMPDHELWIGFLKDPDHNLVGIMEEKRG